MSKRIIKAILILLPSVIFYFKFKSVGVQMDYYDPAQGSSMNYFMVLMITTPAAIICALSTLVRNISIKEMLGSYMMWSGLTFIVEFSWAFSFEENNTGHLSLTFISPLAAIITLMMLGLAFGFITEGFGENKTQTVIN